MRKSRYFILVLFLTLFLGGAYLSFQHIAAPRPLIKVKPMVWKLGRVFARETYVNNFKIYNKGKALLRLDSVRSTCGCAVTEISTNEIPPSQSIDMKVTFNEEPTKGETDKTIYITCNDPYREMVIVKILAEVVPRE